MLWKVFSGLVRSECCSPVSSEKGSIARLLQHRGEASHVDYKKHEWYPAGARHDDVINGYRYVDMNHSFLGQDAVLISEASYCMIIVLLNPVTHTRFCAHISATSDLKCRQWLAMKSDLLFFFKNIDFDVTKNELYIFCNNTFKNQEGSYEQRNFMKLMNSVLDDSQLEKLALSTWLIEGEDGNCWNPYCAVRMDEERLKISFAP